MEARFRVLSAAELPELGALNNRIAEAVWPEFMVNDAVTRQYWHLLYEMWPEYQFGVLEGDQVVALGNSVPLRWDLGFDELPDDGWD